MCRIVHFEIQAQDPERAARFYRDVFGWGIHELVVPAGPAKDENRFWLVMTGPETEPGVNGGIVFRRGPAPDADTPMKGFLCTMSVASLEQYTDRVTHSGGSIVVPRMAIPGIGWWARCTDTEGNAFGMLQADPLAR